MTDMLIRLRLGAGALLLAWASTALAGQAVLPDPAQDPLGTSMAGIDAGRMLRHIETLAGDDFEGRSPGTTGERRTVDYLVTQFRQLGLQPGNPDGSFVQRVPLTVHSSQPSAIIHVGGKMLALSSPQDFVAGSYLRESALRIERSDVVFVGYGVVAPEYGWDDYKGVDLHGKTVIMLVNDPQIPDRKVPGQLDSAMFKGQAMTYYGRWTYKFEQAAALGAAAALIVHETALAAYPWSVVINSFSKENFDIRRDDANPDFPPVAGWLQRDQASALFSAAGLDFEAMKQAALSPDFRPVTLHAQADIQVASHWAEVDSQNVVARIEGSDPLLKDDYVIYSAHWDHFGWDPALPGGKHEQVFHGALDNASGVAALLEIARAWKALPTPPRRSALFLATTAEERGLLGAKYYVAHPLQPLRRTLVDINIDGMNPMGRTHDIEVVGYGNSDLDDHLESAAALQGRRATPDTNAAAGSFYRADHFEFAKAGVPALYTKAGLDYIGRPPGFGDRRRAEYTAHAYHKVNDVPEADWDLSGAAEDARLLFRVGIDVAQASAWPQWRPAAEFAERRQRMLQDRPLPP
jgi:Zn-dependent M28 family amino/carboxypeptidase